MTKKQRAEEQASLGSIFGSASQQAEQWQTQLNAIALRFNQEYRREPFQLPEEVEAMPIFQEWAKGALSAKVSSPFWELAKPKKNQRCLDLGCGVSFLIYPWRDWEAFFYGQDISIVAKEALTARGPQLNSKLFKGVVLGPAHDLKYEDNQFDSVVATGFSCYYPLSYWEAVITAVKKVLKPDGLFLFDVVDADAPLAENWAILETYLGAEVFLESLDAWKKLVKDAGGKVTGEQAGEVFHLFRVKF